MGFSIAILLHLASAKYIKNTQLFCCLISCCFSANHAAPLTARSVQGGCAIIKSHSPSCVCVCVCGHKSAIAIQNWQNIALYMPLGVTAGTILNVTREGSMPSFAERFADFLALLASYQNSHYTSFLLKCSNRLLSPRPPSSGRSLSPRLQTFLRGSSLSSPRCSGSRTRACHP